MTPCEEMAAAMPKRPLNFALFAGYDYEGGGWSDFNGSYASITSAVQAVDGRRYDWWHVVDLSIGQIVSSGRRGY